MPIEFKIGDVISYGSYGIGKIVSREESNDESDSGFIVMEISHPNSGGGVSLRVPIANIAKEIRYIASIEELQSVVDHIRSYQIRHLSYKGDPKSLAKYETVLKSGDLIRIGGQLKELHSYQKSKLISHSLMQLYDRMLSFIITEYSIVLNIKKEVSERFIKELLEENNQ